MEKWRWTLAIESVKCQRRIWRTPLHGLGVLAVVRAEHDARREVDEVRADRLGAERARPRRAQVGLDDLDVAVLEPRQIGKVQPHLELDRKPHGAVIVPRLLVIRSDILHKVPDGAGKLVYVVVV